MLGAANAAAQSLPGTCFKYMDLVESLDADGFLRLHGRGLPREPPFNTAGRISVLVAKRGQHTGLSFGITNEIEAVQRTPHTKDGSRVISLHWLVLDFKGGQFSQKGDSGSCVFDMTGRVLGIVDAGISAEELVRYDKVEAPSEDFIPLTSSTVLGDDAKVLKEKAILSSEVTFVTPIQWIFEGIRDQTGREPRIL